MILASRRFGAVLLLTCASAGTAHAQGLEGAWNASALRASWAIGDWPEECGPRPSGGGEAGGRVTLSPSGEDFVWSGLGRSYSSGQCWERLPGLVVRSHSAGGGTVKTTCTMPPGDPRQATLVTTWSLRGDSLYFDETGRYQLVTGAANCTASVRRTRVLTRVVVAPPAAPSPAALAAAPETPLAPSAPPASEASPARSSPPSDCRRPGPPTLLTVGPKTKLMRAGEAFTFRVEAQDARGCPVKTTPSWRITQGDELGTIEPGGRLTVHEGAPSGHLTLEMAAFDRRLEVSAKVVSAEEYERLLAGGGFQGEGESLDRATVHTNSVVAIDTENAPRPSGGLARWGWGAGLGLGALALGAALLRALGRRRRPLSELSDDADLPPSPSTSTGAPPPVAEAPRPAAPATAKVCPICARTYPHETTFCGVDGARLARLN